MKSTFVAAAAVVLTALASTMGCTAVSSGVGAGDGGTGNTNVGADAGSVTQGGSGLSCLQILQCIGECPESDGACGDACVEKGSPDGQAGIVTFAECIQKEACADADCIQTKCATSLEACITSSAPKSGGKPLEGETPAGSVPTDLVGAWSTTSWGDTDRLTFNADGTGERFLGVVSNSKYCSTRTTVTEKGTIVVTATSITIYASDVVNQEKSCDSRLETTKGNPVVVEFSWSRQDASTIVVMEASCLAKHPSDGVAFCKLVLTKE